ncbi:hypothetical protein CFC21_059316 [Triticum aestivum]|uniref:Uncharacterized protein n=2 Tax=Triticum aestivum TaxID=4565 RepID=A0A9R1GPV0_WHEAT|nr:hypothetical protein CFC21_059315 [Triticum aestivum]KAF7051031.1 hypothetical protein CFC21_059316 [Triticum aestivum]
MAPPKPHHCKFAIATAYPTHLHLRCHVHVARPRKPPNARPHAATPPPSERRESKPLSLSYLSRARVLPDFLSLSLNTAAASRARARQIPRPLAPFFPLPIIPAIPLPASCPPEAEEAEERPGPAPWGSTCARARPRGRWPSWRSPARCSASAPAPAPSPRSSSAPPPRPPRRSARGRRTATPGLATTSSSGAGGSRSSRRRGPGRRRTRRSGREEGRRRWREEDGAGAVVRRRGVRGRPRGLLRRQRAGLGRHRQGHQGDDAVQPDLQLGDDEHPGVGDGSPQPFPAQGADAGVPLRPELARDGRVLRRRGAAAAPELQGQVQLLPGERAPAPGAVRVDGARLLGLPHTSHHHHHHQELLH